MKIFIVTTVDPEYDDNYYKFNIYEGSYNINSVFTDLERAITTAKKAIKDLYEEYEDNLDDIEWGQYTDKCASELSDEDKLELLKELTHLSIKIHVYECTLNDNLETVYKLNRQMRIDHVNGETKEVERRWY